LIKLSLQEKMDYIMNTGSKNKLNQNLWVFLFLLFLIRKRKVMIQLF